ncbi:DNA repair protein Sae2/CtIP [Ascosphaera apis ARSEF 7405]|uniref:DNA repair protein Sae2/CtIP n=1 Tax=Ascosphaera apis ARSEF 7405 TaxID=392613 RepID=A0A168CW90_9EURO|nr:DNA repair protein Sae2/CtIP [Ascosphaera apis ARSEF 7405]
MCALQSLHQKDENQKDEGNRLRRDIAALSNRNDELERQVVGLQGQLKDQQSDAHDDRLSAATSQYEKLHPNQILARKDIDLVDAYKTLYASFQSTIEGLHKTRQSLKFYQQREKMINSYLDMPQFKVSRGHQDVYFQRIDEATFLQNTARQNCVDQRENQPPLTRKDDTDRPDLGQSQVSTLVDDETQLQLSLFATNRGQSFNEDANLHLKDQVLTRLGSSEENPEKGCLQKSHIDEESSTARKRKLDCRPEHANPIVPPGSRLQDILGDMQTPAISFKLKETERLRRGPENGQVVTVEQNQDVVSGRVSNRLPSQSDNTLRSTQSCTQFSVNFAAPRVRDRPLHTLRPADFKVNPDRNDGLDFAFTRVIRNKEMRQCLDTCMRPDCCGQHFRSMATMKPISEEELTFNNLDQFDREALVRESRVESEEELAEWFDHIPISAKKEKLLEARALLYANRYARHRFDYARAPSPPGFWEVDMPDTPAVLQSKEFANQTEAEKVKQMYEEALRPFGRWRFVDE